MADVLGATTEQDRGQQRGVRGELIDYWCGAAAHRAWMDGDHGVIAEQFSLLRWLDRPGRREGTM